MQTTLIGAIAMGVAAAVAWGRNSPKPEQGAVTVCMSQRGNATIFQAQAIASEIFARIGVRLDWKSDKNSTCLSGEQIAITLSDETPAGRHPGELAYSIPYEGTRIVVFYDRLLNSLTRSRLPSVLGYVLVHEIAHDLQRISRHSATGIMKPKWGVRDYREMDRRTLTFTEDDVYLIRRGLEERVLH